jgi:hypothetical protein
LIFGIDNTFSTLGFSLLELNKDIICSDTMSIYNLKIDKINKNDSSNTLELELEYFDLFLSLETITETNTFNYVILKNVNKNIKIDLSKVTKFQRNVNIWLINNINHISKFKNGKKYYFSDKPNIYDNKILNKKTLSYLYLTKPPKNKSLTNYKYVIYEKNNPIQFLFPESQIINMEQI